MLLDPTAAKALFAIVIAATQGTNHLNRQLPLHATDRGDSWLVMGSPYTDENFGTRYNMCHMFVDKRTAEVKGIECHGRLIMTKEEELSLSRLLPPGQRLATGPFTEFQPARIHELWQVIYGGVVSTPETAVEYAAVLMRMKPGWAHIAPGELIATERDKVWHIRSRKPVTGDLLAISRVNGKVLFGDR